MVAGETKTQNERLGWKSVFLSSTHCASGCVLGDIVAAPLVAVTGWTLLGERLFGDYVVEFAFRLCVRNTIRNEAEMGRTRGNVR
jgi:hypothetical protein